MGPTKNRIGVNNLFSNIKKDDFFFESDGVLTLKQGSLRYLQNIKYEIKVSTLYRQIEYYQKVRVNIENVNEISVHLIE
jgi:hypothetical protein